MNLFPGALLTGQSPRPFPASLCTLWRVLTSLPLWGVVWVAGGPASAALEGVREASGAAGTWSWSHTLQHSRKTHRIKELRPPPRSPISQSVGCLIIFIWLNFRSCSMRLGSFCFSNKDIFFWFWDVFRVPILRLFSMIGDCSALYNGSANYTPLPAFVIRVYWNELHASFVSCPWLVSACSRVEQSVRVWLHRLKYSLFDTWRRRLTTRGFKVFVARKSSTLVEKDRCLLSMNRYTNYLAPLPIRIRSGCSFSLLCGGS